MSEELVAALSRAVDRAPDDLDLRLHLAQVLIDQGSGTSAIEHLAIVLAAWPDASAPRQLMAVALGATDGRSSRVESGHLASPPAIGVHPDQLPAEANQAEADPPPTTTPAADFDWRLAEDQVAQVAPPMFVDSSPAASDVVEVERSGVRLSDVGGLAEVKARLDASFLAPLRNPELRQMYGLSLRGGLLMYGPPGCGKTFLARAVAGELGAQFIHVSVADVLDMYTGSSERNVQELFRVARASAPCVLFFDELDALGQKRSLQRGSSGHNTVNQLLTELDGVGSRNDGLYVLAATNQPWDVDPALRRPGRFDRTLLVLPPDAAAREAILRTHLRERPIAAIDTARLAADTDGFSGADLALLCQSAVEVALLDSVRSGTPRLITMADFDLARRSVRPSIAPWVELARNVAVYGNASGEYDELAEWIRRTGKRRGR